jgi:peroxiredoxin
MKRNLKITLAAAAGVASLSYLLAPAFAQGLKLEERFQQFDTDSNGVLSGEELNARPMLKMLDLDANGSVDKVEALKALAQMKGKLQKFKPAESAVDPNRTETAFRLLDKNSDGALSSQEMKDRQIFEKLDQNQDGSVKLAEAIGVLGEILPERYRPKNSETPEVTASSESVADLKEQPQRLKATEHGVGRQVPALTLSNLKGQAVNLTAEGSERAVVIAFFGATCPISGKLGPELARLEKDYRDKSVRFILCDPVSGESQEEIQSFLTAHGLTSPAVHDLKKEVSTRLGATTTTEVFVIDAARTLVYRGAINDQYGLGYTKEAPKVHYLRTALDAVLRNEAPEITATTAPGCALDLDTARSEVITSTVTYHREISRIMQNHCVECHRADGLGPFSLQTYADVVEHAGMIKKQVQRGAMPPWFAAKQAGDTESPWANDCSLSERDKRDLITWIDSSRPEGDAKDQPLARTWPKEWSIGKPDHIVQLPRPVSIKAEGVMPYQFLTTETTFTEDKWVKGYEILPTDRAVVHHVIVSVHPKGRSVRDRDEGTSGYWAAYVPGNSKQVYPKGFARKLPAGATVSFQIHYTPNGRATQDQLRMGLLFAEEEPQFVVETIALPKRKLNIPPGQANHVEVETRTIPFDLNAMAFMAHMHVRGKAFKYEVIKADGTHQNLLDIPRYDFNWQLRYDLAQHQTLRRGDTLKITAVFDNSAGNAANPDPTRPVKWGPQTSDEMMIGYIEHFKPAPSQMQARATP